MDNINNISSDDLEDFNKIIVGNYSYDNGFLDGILGVEPEHFKTFIENNGNRNLEKLQLARLGAELLEKENEINEIKAKSIINTGHINTANNEIQFINSKIQVEEEKIKKQQDFLNCRAAYLDSVPSKTTNLAVAIIFILVAIIFLVADVGVIQYVFRQIFNMYSWDGWMYSIAVTLVSFVFKPGIDRVIEKPYLVDEKKSRTHYFYGFLALFTILVIGCVGYIRAKGIGLIGGDGDSLIQFLQFDILVMCTFVGCAILFPICGSICLSIGVNSIDVYRKKKIANKSLSKSIIRITELRKEIKDYLILKENAIFALTLLRKPEVVIEEIALIKERTALHLENYFAKEIEAEKDIYEQAKARGEKYNLTEELRITPAKIAVLLGIWPPGNGNKNQNKPSNQLGSAKSKSGYLHEQLRSMIEYNHKKN